MTEVRENLDFVLNYVTCENWETVTDCYVSGKKLLLNSSGTRRHSGNYYKLNKRD